MEKLKNFYQDWQHLASPAFFVGGFLLDIVTLGRIDETTNILLFIIYLLVSLFIFAWELELFKINTDSYSSKHPLSLLRIYRDEIFHFSQGALLSAFTLFYFKSASHATSLIFLFAMTAFLLINELPFIQKLGPVFKGLLLQINILSLLLVYIPLIFGQVGTIIFLVALSTYCLVVGGGFYFLKKKELDIDTIKKSWLIPGISLFVVICFLRTFSLMPPVPLSLEKAGIYHKVERDYPLYNLYHEREWWRIWNSSDEYFRAAPGDAIYFFTRIFAPGGFKDMIYLHWQKSIDGDWQTSDRIPLKISGGRQQGYRGFSFKTNHSPGEWRVLVETKSGLEIGRLSFEIEEVPAIEKERVFKKEVDGKR